ncbi:MAG: hypothetical protein ACTHLN_06620, partial [Tepidisphaeraceae bacterium]
KARKPVGPVKMLVTLLLILAVGVAIVMTMRPEWRDQSLAWVSGRWLQVRHSLEQPAAPKTPSERPAAPAPAVAVNPPAPAVPKAAPSHPEANAPETNAAEVRPATPRPESTRVEAPPADSRSAEAKPAPAPAPAPAEAPKPAAVPIAPPPRPVVTAPKPEPVAPKPEAPAPAVEIPQNLTIDQAISLASDLRNRAMDAEAKHDWATAVHLYEQIMTLPRDAWPADVQLRLDNDRRNAG